MLLIILFFVSIVFIISTYGVMFIVSFIWIILMVVVVIKRWSLWVVDGFFILWIFGKLKVIEFFVLMIFMFEYFDLFAKNLLNMLASRLFSVDSMSIFNSRCSVCIFLLMNDLFIIDGDDFIELRLIFCLILCEGRLFDVGFSNALMFALIANTFVCTYFYINGWGCFFVYFYWCCVGFSMLWSMMWKDFFWRLVIIVCIAFFVKWRFNIFVRMF